MKSFLHLYSKCRLRFGKQDAVTFKKSSFFLTKDLFARRSSFSALNFRWRTIQSAFGIPNLSDQNSVLSKELQLFSLPSPIASLEPIEPEQGDGSDNTLSVVSIVDATVPSLRLQRIGDELVDFYIGAKGRLIEPLKKMIKDIKIDLDISDEDMPERYSACGNGGNYYLVLGEDPCQNKGIFRGVRQNDTMDNFKSFINDKKGLYANLYHQLVGNYKIHLMPKSFEDYIYIIKELVTLVKNNNELQESLAYFKVYTDVDFELSPHDIAEQLKERSCVGILPVIVLYPASGKEHAQKVLDSIYKRFGMMEGLGYAPCYNEMVTTLIYFAQGNRDVKDGNFLSYFCSTGVYYGGDFKGAPSYQYRLKNPELEKILTQFKRALYLNRKSGDTEKVDHLIKKLEKMNFSAKCADLLGYSLLDYAYTFKYKAAIELLRQCGAIRSKVSPLRLLSAKPMISERFYEDKNDILALVLEEDGVDCNAGDKMDNSLFYYALKQGNVGALTMLAQSKRANINARNKKRNTPLGQFLSDVVTEPGFLSPFHLDAVTAFLLLKPQLEGTNELFNRLEIMANNPLGAQLVAKIGEYQREVQDDQDWVRV